MNNIFYIFSNVYGKTEVYEEDNRHILAEEYKGKRMLERAEELKTSWAYTKEVKTKTTNQLTLFNNVQFIYELALAQLELESFGVEYQVTNGLREFLLLKADDTDTLRKRLAYFKAVENKLTDYFFIVQKNRTHSVNQYLTHWIYPYKGKFHPQMIRALMNITKLREGDTVLDPFIGSGTTALEAQLLGINCVGIDASPLCILQSKVKTESIDAVKEIEGCKDNTLDKVSSLFNLTAKSPLEKIEFISNNERVKNFYKLAWLVALSDSTRRHRNFENSLINNLNLMIGSVKDYQKIVEELNLKLGEVDLRIGDSRKLPLRSNSIDGIITSPPYSIALDYVANDAHALKAMGYDLPEMREEFMGVRGKGATKIELYNRDMIKSLEEMYKVLKPGKYAVIIIGNATYMGKEIKTVEFTVEQAKKVGFKLTKDIDKIIFGLYNVMQKENILIFKKE